MIDLKAIAGIKYRIALDESKTADSTRSERLWLYRIPCKYGFISVHSPEMLAAWTGNRGIISRLVEIPGVQVKQRGDREVRVLFGPDRLDAIADLLKARRRPRLTDEQRQQRSERAKKNLRKPIASDAPSRPDGSGGIGLHPGS
jgi:hypothetical protein